jgi:hypothetical protein
MQRTAEVMMAEAKKLVKALVAEAREVRGQAGVEGLERSVREKGQEFLRVVFEQLLQGVLNRQEEGRACPVCGGRRRHKGVRCRGVVSSVGAIELEGPYWYCRRCRSGQHALDALAPESFSGVMEELLCLLGTSMTSFAKAGEACKKLLGVRLSTDMIWRLCRRAGQRVLADPPAAPEVAKETDLVGSCDGTMVNTRQDGWRELKAYRYEHPGGVYGGAHLEGSERFLPRLRQAALAMGAVRARRIFFVSDAAEWIDKGVAVQLPMAIRIVDIWHAYQHVHEAGRKLYGEGTPKGGAWADRWCRHLREHGGRVTWWSLRRVRFKDAARQAALEALLGYLDRNAERMDYPTYERAGWPISSGAMESFCKQLGGRLKGPGMRWSLDNVDPMAALVILWSQDRWDDYWSQAI